ncbi:MAG: phosphatase PAP2 family protein [Bacteroidota bacterium]
MIETLIGWDKELLLFLNGMHNDFLDFIMFWISEKFIWIPFYLFLFYLVIKNYKLRTIDVLVVVAVLITASDMISVHGFKEVFHRLRPCQDPSMKQLVHIVYNECGGLYSFVSSHATNTFALCFFMICILGKKIKWITPVMIIWASVVSYTRIYLGVHYPFDVLCGAILGILTGLLIGKTFNWYYMKFVLKKLKNKTDVKEN